MVRPLLTILLLAAPVLAQDGWKPYKCRPLDFEIAIPKGWKAQQDRTGMIAQSADAGFSVSREPFLHTEKGFADAWKNKLAKAGISAPVKAKKARGYAGYHAAWKAEKEGRFIEVWRLHVPVNEMLYNFSFSAKDQEQLKPLVDAVLRAFKVTAKPPTLKFQKEEVALGTRSSVRVPVGYVKAPRAVRLGGGIALQFTRVIPGYEKPHVVGVINVGGVRGQSKKEVKVPWDSEESQFAKVLKKPRIKSVKYNGFKGHKLSATVLGKGGLPKRYMVFVGKMGRSLVLVKVVVDERVARMYGDYLKLVCSQLKLA